MVIKTHDYELAMKYRDVFIDAYDRINAYLTDALRREFDDSEDIIYGIKGIMDEYKTKLKVIDIG